MPSPATPVPPFSPGRAYWNQRFALAESRDRILALSHAVGRPSDLSTYQFSQLLAAALEFSPDLILELGRGKGNSTCAFTEAANLLSVSAPCRVLSLCMSKDWAQKTVPKLRAVVPSSWFEPLTAEVGDLLKYDYKQVFAGAKRVLVFWDAHGFDIAECVLGVIAPIVADRPHVFLMHDMSDTRYASGQTGYGGQRLWHGENAGSARFRLGNIDSAVAQAISAQDFTTRNRITLDSADHSIDLELNQVPGRVQEIQTLLGEELFAMQAHWFWFSLNEHPGPYTFPRFALGERSFPSGWLRRHRS